MTRLGFVRPIEAESFTSRNASLPDEDGDPVVVEARSGEPAYREIVRRITDYVDDAEQRR